MSNAFYSSWIREFVDQGPEVIAGGLGSLLERTSDGFARN
jgi:hypothetical protein